MYSHSLKFGDAPPFRTGCTAVVDAKLQGPALTGDGVLCDILAAQKALKNVLDVLDHADLGSFRAQDLRDAHETTHRARFWFLIGRHRADAATDVAKLL